MMTVLYLLSIAPAKDFGILSFGEDSFRYISWASGLNIVTNRIRASTSPFQDEDFY